MVRPARRSGASAARSSRDRPHRPHTRPSRPASERVCALARRTARAGRGAASSTAARWRRPSRRRRGRPGPVSARSGPSAARLSTVRRSSGQQQRARLARLEAGAGGEPLGRRLERDQEVRGDRCRRVVGGAALVVDLERHHAEPRASPAAKPSASGWSRRWRSPRRRTRPGRGRRRTSAAGAARTLRRRPAPAPSAAWPRWCGRRAARPPPRLGRRRDLGVGHAEHERAAARDLAAARRALDGVPAARSARSAVPRRPGRRWPRGARLRGRRYASVIGVISVPVHSGVAADTLKDTFAGCRRPRSVRLRGMQAGRAPSGARSSSRCTARSAAGAARCTRAAPRWSSATATRTPT